MQKIWFLICMAEPLKNYYNQALIDKLADNLAIQYGAFNKKSS